MPEDKKTDHKPAAEQKQAEPKAAAAKPLQSAAASGDPAVHQLLAERQTAQMNEDADAVRDVDKRLADLGFK
jgi:hypothetical protein